MTQLANSKIRFAPPRSREAVIAHPQTQAPPARGESFAPQLTLAAIVVATPLTAVAVALAGALGA